MSATIILMAKQPVPGRVKTRLHPPLTLQEAAQVAAASLEDTLAAMAQVEAKRVLCLQGRLETIPGFDLIPQSEGGLDQRIATVLDEVQGDVVLIGMDTPQLRADRLRSLIHEWPTESDALFGPATDGGFWMLGVRRAERLAAVLPKPSTRGDLVRGVPMSRADTGALQLRRLTEAGLSVQQAETLTDIDDLGSLLTVSGVMDADSAVARVVGRLRTLPMGTRA